MGHLRKCWSIMNKEKYLKVFNNFRSYVVLYNWRLILPIRSFLSGGGGEGHSNIIQSDVTTKFFFFFFLIKYKFKKEVIPRFCAGGGEAHVSIHVYNAWCSTKKGNRVHFQKWAMCLIYLFKTLSDQDTFTLIGATFPPEFFNYFYTIYVYTNFFFLEYGCD